MDKIDLKLIYELDKNSRQSLSSVAKRLRIGRNVALYRINRLKEKGIIKGSFTEINMLSLGYFTFRLFLNIGNFSDRKKQDLIDFVKEEPKTIWLFKVLGKWDIDLVYVAKDIFEFEDFRRKLFLQFSDIIVNHHVSVLTQIYHYPKDYLISKKRTIGSNKKLYPTKKYEVDSTELKMLHLLSNDAQMNIINLAKKCNISVNTAKSKIKTLVDNKVILGFRLTIDTNKLGYNYYKFHVNLKSYSQSDLNKFKSYLESKSFVVYIDHYLGGDDFEIELHLENETDFIRFREDLLEEFGCIIKDHFVLKFFEELVYMYFPVLKE